MALLVVTSFGSDMFDASGRGLVESFLATHSDGSLLLCTEQNAAAEYDGAPILKYQLEDSKFLTEWLETNREIIPPHLGGTAKPCTCPAKDAFRGHYEGCIWLWWNKNASRWFRKVVALDYAVSLHQFDTILWLDSDCLIVQKLTEERVVGWFQNASLFIFKSVDRRVVESGVMGVRGEQGRRFVRLTAERFRCGAFRNDQRWDDGYQFQRVLDLHPEITRTDLATHASGQQHVVENSVAAAYIEHCKGKHAAMRVSF